jgi:hypothetical protein
MKGIDHLDYVFFYRTEKRKIGETFGKGGGVQKTQVPTTGSWQEGIPLM